MRWLFYVVSILGLIITAITYQFSHYALYILFILVPYILIGIRDILSVKHTVLRNYPVIGHIRYILEAIRPEIQQYFIESDKDGLPYNRQTRSLVYQKSKGETETIGFGTQNDITSLGYEFSHHSIFPKHITGDKYRIIFGGQHCSKPYSASRFNISGMSYGAISPNAIRALNKGANMGGFAHNTGEGGISPYHLEHGGDLIWQIGTGYFGCRKKNGRFDPDAFAKKAALDIIKMIEIKISQGAKPSHGGLLPAVKVNKEIAEIRMLEAGVDAISPAMHPEFCDPISMMKFIAKIRDLSGGKPVGFKICLGRREEFLSICKAMIETGITPDFITIDGAEGGTGAAPLMFANKLGTPLNEALAFVHNILVATNLRDKMRIIASGKIATGYDMIVKIALGADVCNAARGMMFALGCIQSLSCNTDRCPTGVATQNEHRWKVLDVQDKSSRVYNFQRKVITSFNELLEALGVEKPEQLDATYIRKYIDIGVSRTFAEIFPQLEDGELLKKNSKCVYADLWNLVRSDSFNLPNN